MEQDPFFAKILAAPGSCPNCESENLRSSDLEGENCLTLRCSCEDCDAEWFEHYALKGAVSHKIT